MLHDVSLAVGRNARGHALNEIAVGIDKGAPRAGCDVVTNERLKQRRLADTCFPDHIHVGKPIDLLDTECSERTAGIGAAK